MKRVLISIVGILCCFNAFSQESFFHLSFVPPLSTHGSRASQYTNNFSFNILAGISRNERGFTLGGLTNIIVNDAQGFQLAGINNITGGSGSGFQLAGISNMVKGDYHGFQMGGITNLNRGRMTGGQLGGIFNVAGELTGMQIGGVVNITRNARGFQLAGLANISQDVSGFQLGGLFNVARNVRGVQMAGLLNIAVESDYPIGLINIIKNGEKSIGVSYNETGSSTISFRSGGRVLYGIIGAGYNHKANDEKYVMEGGLGAHINISKRFRINNELKTAYMTSFNSTHVSHHSFSILPAFKITRSWEVYGGPSINFMESDNVNNGKLFPNHSLWKKYTDSKMKQLYVGYTVGTHFLF